MRILQNLLLGTVALLGAGASAMAADAIVIPPPPAPPPPAAAPVVAPAFAGPYWGLYGAYLRAPALPQAPNGVAGIGSQFGYNFAAGNFRFGFEVETEIVAALPFGGANTAVVNAGLSARAGVVLGDRVFLYAEGGRYVLVLVPYWSVGGGVEVALSPKLSLFAEGQVHLSPAGLGLPTGWIARAGLNYYADRGNLDEAATFDWGGLYFGVSRGPLRAGGAYNGVQVGYNFGHDHFIAGIEVETVQAPIIISGPINVMGNARAGVALGPVLLYAEAGIGQYGLTNVWSVGGGGELALGDRFSLFAEAERLTSLGGALVGTYLSAGANIHFGR